MFKGEKGQISIFVIIGIVLVIGVALFLILRNNTAVITDDFEKDVTSASPSFKPVQDYVELCMGQVTRDAIDLVGAHGGYIYPFDPEYDGFFTYNEGDTGNNDGVLLGESESNFVPYWIKSKSSVDTDLFNVEVMIPTTSQVEAQIGRYVDDHLEDCITNFSSVSQLGFVVLKKENPSSQVMITQDDVAVKTTMKMILEKDGQEQEFEKFIVRDPIPLSEYLTKASLIAFEEYNSQYLENMVVHLISYYGRIDSNSLPPLSMYSDDTAPLVWTQMQINEQIRSLLDSYIPLFRFQETNNLQQIDNAQLSQQEQDFYNSFLLSTIVAPRDDFYINHIFLHWDIYSKVTSSSSSGDIITIVPKSRDGFMMKAPESESYYNFYYDITYPVVVELVDKNLSDGTTYTFLFAMEANIRNNINNQDYINGRGPIEWDPNKITYAAPGSNSPGVPLTSESGEEVAFFPNKKLFSDTAMFTSGNVSLSAYDACSGLPLGDVFVSVGIADYAQTRVGMTQFDVYGNAIFNSKLPVMQNGYLVLKKGGYQDTYVPLSTYEGQELDFGAVPMNRIVTKQVDIKVFEDLSSTMQASDLNTVEQEEMPMFVTRPINPSEQIVFMFTKITSERDLSPYSQFIIANSSTGVQNIDFVSGKYLVKAILIDEDGVVVPEDSKKVCDGFINCLFMSEEEKYIPDDPIEIKPATWGGLEFDEEMPWMLTKQDLCNASNQLILTSYKFPPPKNIDDLKNIGDTKNITKMHRVDLMPKFVELEEN